MRADRNKKKKKRRDESIILKEATRIAERTMDAVLLQIMDEIEKMWISKGGTVSK